VTLQIHNSVSKQGAHFAFITQMSATLDTKLFGTFFHGSPIVNVPGRTFPVRTFYLEDVLEHTNHIIEEGSRHARRDFNGRETVSMYVTSRGGERRREQADYQMNEDVSDDFPGYKLATRK
jgi:HrpA-like RNA helicase